MIPKKILLASNNSGKIKEFKELLAPSGVDILSLKELNIDSNPPEEGLTFLENALIKARHAATLSGYPTIADDSGLVVPHLNGAPGIHSARYSSLGDDRSNNLYLLQQMADLTGDQRSAYFVALLIYLEHPNDPQPLVAEGICRGTILTEPDGDGGFGYDPLFYYPPLKRSFAALSSKEKGRVSHRAQGVKKLLTLLNERYPN